MANPLRVNTAELLRRSGSERIVDVTMTVAELGLVDERFLAPDPVAIRLRLESLTDGVVVAGTVAVDWRGVCRRCATDAGGTLCTEIHELYQETAM